MGRSSPASFWFYAFDTWLLNIAVGVPKEVIQVEYYASNAAVLRLSSLKLVNSMIDLNLNNFGKCFVTILSFLIENYIIFC